MTKSSNKNRLYTAILLSQIVALVDMVMFLTQASNMMIIDLFRYASMVLAAVFVLSYSWKNRQHISFFQTLFSLWVMYIMVTAIPDILNPARNHINFKLFATNYFFLYSIPFMMMAEPSLTVYRDVMKLSFWMSLLYIVAAVVVFSIFGAFTSYPSELATIMLEGGVLLLMTYPYHKRQKMNWVIIAMLIGIMLMMVLSRRNRVVYFGGGFILAIILIELNSKINSAAKVALPVTLILLGSIVLSSSLFDEFFYRMSLGMSSREAVIENYNTDFNSTPSDWIWGRGMFGNYDGGVSNDGTTGFREGIENGYLQLILKGGGVWLGLLVIISLISVYKGLFKSKNYLCKGFAFIILLYYVDMIGFGVPTITLKYIMVYLSIGGCNSKWLLNCTDEYLAEQIGLK